MQQNALRNWQRCFTARLGNALQAHSLR